MLKIVLLLLSIASLTIQKCSLGCLKCDEDDNCLFCDPSQNYKLVNKECQKVTLDNCKMMNFEGLCYLCIQEYYLDVSTKKCLAVPTTNLIDNCINYSTQSSCSHCDENYYMSGNTCKVVETLIDNCSYYEAENICMQCEGDYLLSLDKKSCTENPAQANCSFYSRAFCNKCDEDYFLNYLLYTDELYRFTNDSKKKTLTQHYNEMILGKSGIKFVKVCQRIEVLNCLIPANATECQECEDGYFLDTQNKCIKFPEEGIFNCYKYENIQTCTECLSGYYLQSNSACIAVEPITNCIKYDGTANISKCAECRSGYYSAGTQCTERVNSKGILNCTKLHFTEDKCETCNSNFIIASDGLRCFNMITNCEVYGDQSSSNDSAICTECIQGFYLADSKTCIQGNVANCGEYRGRAEDCDQCLNTYYLKSGVCEKHNTLANCETYSNSEPNTCLTCEGNYYNFKVVQICKAETPINNCKAYEERSPLKCTECELGYFLNGNQCDFISESNCAVFDGTSCTNCNVNYALDLSTANPTCVSVYSHISANCEITSVSEFNEVGQSLDEVSCEKCQSFTVPLDHRKHYVCVRNDQLEQIGVTNDRIVSGCIKYNSEKNCVQCESSKFLGLDNTCVSTCPSGVYKTNQVYKTGSDTSLTVVFDGYNICMDTNTNFYKVYSFNLDLDNNTSLDIPVKCQDNYLPIVYTVSKDSTNVNYTKSPDSFIEHPQKLIPGISVCAATTANSPLISNCDYYTYVKLKNVNEIRCLKCKHGYTSIISEDLTGTSGNQVSYFISQCQRDSICKTDYQDGLDLVWVKFFSCHVCTSSLNIPFLPVLHEANNRPIPVSFRKYNLDSINHININDNDLKNQECLIDKAETFGYSSSVNGELEKYQALPLNCGLGILNLSLTDGDSRGNRAALANNVTTATKLSQYCGACKPGYKATPINNIYPHIKISCQKISNCIGTKWFNKCSQCSTNYVYKFDNNQIDYSACIANSMSNCYAAISSDICMACKKGFQLNKDNRCEALNPPNCKSSANFNLRKEYVNKKNIAYGIFHDVLGVGCNECTSGYTAVELNESTTNPFVCTTSSYIQQNSNNLSDSTNYVKFCENYGIDNENLICVSCLSQYVLNPNKDTCYNGPVGCEEADSSTRCLKCQIGYTLVNNLCQQANISFCLEYNLDQNTSTARCTKCEPNYYLTNLYECELGDVPNCEWYTDTQRDKCRECLDGYALFKNGTYDYCYKIHESLSCKEATIRSNNTYGSEIECTSCNEPYQLLTNLTSDITEKTKCMEFNAIANCQTYDKKETINDSTLRCNVCNDGFYLSSPRNCLARSYKAVTCLEYQTDQDRCKNCDANSYKDDIGRCQIKPSGIQQCLDYLDLSTCQTCEVNYYLENNTCKAVPNENLIAGCELYINANTCQLCQKGYVLTGNICEIATATGCLTYLSVSACESCDINYGLQETNGVINCVLVNKPNCLEFTPSGNFPCLECAANFYLDSSDNCAQVNPLIPNCLYYESNDVCKQCVQGSALSSDGKTCESLSSFTSVYDENCLSYKNEIHCSVCRPGSYFEGTTCSLCENSSSCFKCNPEKIEECLLCQTGYYMNSDLQCIAESSGSTDPDPTSSLRILIVSYYLCLILTIFF